MADPLVKPIGESLWVVWPERATLEFSRVHEHRDTLSAEVSVVSTTAGELSWARLNLASTQARASLAKTLEQREPTEDWLGLVERSCRLAAKHIRTGEPAEPLIAAPPSATAWAVEGWIPHGQITVLFGDGGAGKSYLAMTLALSGLFDRPITPRWRMMPLRRVLYLDWEADRPAQQSRLWRLAQGWGSEPHDGAFLHRTMRRALVDDLTAIRAEAARGEVDLVICDSLAPASGPEPEHADAALAALLALRSLGVTVLCIAHVSKVQADAKAPARPYGSVHIQNLARSTIEARGSDADSEGEATVSLYHRKLNDGRKQAPSALRFTFEPEGAIRVGKGEPDTAGASLAYQVLEALRGEAKAPSSIAEVLDAATGSVKKTLQRLENRGKVVRLSDRVGGRGKEQLWGLRDSNRDNDQGNTGTTGTPDDVVPF